MSREIISIHIGQCGVQQGSAIWEQYCREHSIDLDGISLRVKARREEMYPAKKITDGDADGGEDDVKESALLAKLRSPRAVVGPSKSEIAANNVFFDCVDSTGAFVPRAIVVDLESNVIDSMINSPFGNLFHRRALIHGKEDAANNYARGRYTVGRDLLPSVEEELRKMIERCDAVQAILFNYAVAGGTGSGFGGLLSHQVNEKYQKIPKISFVVYPSPTLSTAVVEPYNAMLATSDLINEHNVVCMLDNEACYNLTREKILSYNRPESPKPSYGDINYLVTKAISSITSGIRFRGESQFDVNQMQTNLVPFPKLHFMTSSLAPIIAESDDSYGDASKLTEDFIAAEVASPKNMFVSYKAFEPEHDRYLGVMLTFRGNVGITAANAAVQKVKDDKMQFVEWVPTGFKISYIEKPITPLPGDGIKFVDKGCAMIGNCIAVSRPLKYQVADKFDMLYSQRAFVHWYVGEGMEEGEFGESREDIESLINDYVETMKSGDVDDDDEAVT